MIQTLLTSMEPESMVESLVESKIISLSGSKSDVLKTTNKYEEKKKEYNEMIAQYDNGVDEYLSERGIPTPQSFSRATGDESEQFCSIYAAIGELQSDRDQDELLRMALLLYQFETAVPDGGTPEDFLSVSGQVLPLITPLLDPGVVYVWKSNCDPCETVKADLEALSDEHQVTQLSVYAPDAPSILPNEYDVNTVPTILFFCNGTVDSRLIGSRHSSAIENEIEIIIQRSGTR